MIRPLLLGLVLAIAAADGASAQNKTAYGAGMGGPHNW